MTSPADTSEEGTVTQVSGPGDVFYGPVGTVVNFYGPVGTVVICHHDGAQHGVTPVPATHTNGHEAAGRLFAGVPIMGADANGRRELSVEGRAAGAERQSTAPVRMIAAIGRRVRAVAAMPLPQLPRREPRRAVRRTSSAARPRTRVRRQFPSVILTERGQWGLVGVLLGLLLGLLVGALLWYAAGTSTNRVVEPVVSPPAAILFPPSITLGPPEAAAPAAPPAVEATVTTSVVTVQAGDTLWALAAELLGRNPTRPELLRLVEENNLTNLSAPQDDPWVVLLTPGMTLDLSSIVP
ncbi:MAG: hypothetical protein WD850_01440 [Candidatus Spechtbacterales bacterium]